MNLLQKHDQYVNLLVGPGTTMEDGLHLGEGLGVFEKRLEFVLKTAFASVYGTWAIVLTI